MPPERGTWLFAACCAPVFPFFAAFLALEELFLTAAAAAEDVAEDRLLAIALLLFLLLLLVPISIDGLVLGILSVSLLSSCPDAPALLSVDGGGSSAPEEFERGGFFT